MATLRACRVCGKDVSDEARACPHCGQKWPWREPGVGPLPKAVSLLIILGCTAWAYLNPSTARLPKGINPLWIIAPIALCASLAVLGGHDMFGRGEAGKPTPPDEDA